jgi:hypothetical protein
MAKKGNVFVNLFKNALGLPTSDCCSLPVATAQGSACCSDSKAQSEGSQTATTKA